MKILIVNGVNLQQLGTREVDIYGSISFDSYLSELKSLYPDVQFDYFQFDNEGDLANVVANAKGYEGVVLNAGAYTHSSVILADAVRTTSCPVVEVHISNLFGREQYRKNSVLSSCCAGFISGFGLDSYRLAVEFFAGKKINMG
ncbi:MAG: 3-dehydroquinate dehydratase [Bacteroidales bacterium]|nr:3-dehydroquinate dehydratase [Bacteroidales bacterium]MBR0304254.1 3-dehydroquinate dehydratase [Bacteroidales bacterium]